MGFFVTRTRDCWNDDLVSNTMWQLDKDSEKVLIDTVEGLGYELWGYELLAGNQTTLRIYIDCLGGITIDDCTKVDKQLRAVTRVEQVNLGRYRFEVSSPGLGRGLFKLKQYEKYMGKKIKLRLRTPVDNQKNFVGIIEKVTDSQLSLKIRDEVKTFLFSNVEKANLIFEN